MKEDEIIMPEAITDKFKEAWADIVKDRYKKFKGYVFDRLIFRMAFLLVVIGLFYVAWLHGFDMDYFACDASPVYSADNFSGFSETEGLCKNPFYDNNSWKSFEYLPSGEYGIDIGIFNYILSFVFGVMLVAILLNHAVHKQRRK